MRVLALLCAAAVAGACGPGSGRDADAFAAREVSLPDLSSMDESVRTQVQQRHDDVLAVVASDAPAAERARAYGALGMVLHAGEFYEAAEPAYLNAQDLVPQDRRWPYYLGHLHQAIGDSRASMAAFERALALKPDDVPTLVWLGRTHLTLGEADLAAPLFERALETAPRTVAALAGLGQAALARRDFPDAVARFEEALAIDPDASSLHAPLAQAYQQLGEDDQARSHLARWRNTELLVPDPLGQDLDLSIESGLSYEQRGVRALDQENYALAAELFERGVRLTTADTGIGRSLRHKLGTALYMTGDVPGAVRWFEEALSAAPGGEEQDEAVAKAQYSLGILMASAGRGQDAIRYLAAAVRSSPSYREAHQALGDALRRAGEVERSLDAYQDALDVTPQSGEARFGYALALVRLGRHRDARAWLEEAIALLPDRLDLTPQERGVRQQFPHALARLLAASPDDRVRDGRRAVEITEALFRASRTSILGETMAMAYAEVGDYGQAADIQRSVMEAARRAGLQDEVDRLSRNLRRYEQGQPCREPWAADDPVHAPGPPIDPELRAQLAGIDTSARARPLDDR
jgi:tetratricopeptide (TPR) repeat protein